MLLDEMYPGWLAEQLREAGRDVLAVVAVEVGLAARSDEDVLAWATRNERCVVTENVADFARLAAYQPHAGLILVSARKFPRTHSGLDRISHELDRILVKELVPTSGEIYWL